MRASSRAPYHPEFLITSESQPARRGRRLPCLFTKVPVASRQRRRLSHLIRLHAALIGSVPVQYALGTRTHRFVSPFFQSYLPLRCPRAMALMPRESAKLISGLSKNVFIEEEGVKNLACAVLEGLKDHTIHMNNFSQCEFHPKPEDPRAADWIFVLDTLNFSFWTPSAGNKWTVNGQTGYFALCAAIKRAIDEGKPIVEPKYYSEISRAEVEQIFRGDDKQTVIPLLDERVKNLRQAGKILLTKYQGSFVECVKSCGNSAERLLKLIVNEFESYQDEADYQSHKVSFYKRAQILIGDIWACFKGQSLGKFHDIEYITMFADYRIPQVLLHFGAMRYSNPLLSRLNADIELENGSEEEVEIRGCSIEVVERVRDEVKALIKRYPNLGLTETDINAILIDHFLWDYRRRNASQLESIPFHKTRCIYY